MCAPSNAATDELLERLLRDGFRDLGGSRFGNVYEGGECEGQQVWATAGVNCVDIAGAAGVNCVDIAGAAGVGLWACGRSSVRGAASVGLWACGRISVQGAAGISFLPEFKMLGR